MGASILVRLQAYIEPLFLLAISIFYFPVTLFSHPLLLLISPSSFRSKWFENFWRVLGPKMAANEVQVKHIGELLSRAHGKVLELGPGAGDQMFHYKAGQVEALYAAEPNAFLHGKLGEAAAKYGLGSKIVTLEAGAQPGSLLPALKEAGLIPSIASSLPEEGVFDTIVTIKSLCSAPQEQLAATVAVIQALLKPGGEFLFFEHVDNSTDTLTISYAWLVDWIWPVFMGGCRLNGKLDKVVLGMGGWDERTITTVGDFKGHEVCRIVVMV
jgi:SAM-dependent methyltransferase